MHVVKRLPNASNLSIVVDSPAGTKIVSLPKMIRALKWLKKNNWLYADIHIDEHFAFSKNDEIRFLGDSLPNYVIATEDDDCHLLSQKEITFQSVINTDTVGPKGTTFDQYVLVRTKIVIISTFLFFVKTNLVKKSIRASFY